MVDGFITVRLSYSLSTLSTGTSFAGVSSAKSANVPRPNVNAKKIAIKILLLVMCAFARCGYTISTRIMRRRSCQIVTGEFPVRTNEWSIFSKAPNFTVRKLLFSHNGMGCFGLKTVSTTIGKMMMKNPTKKKSLIASAIFVAFVSTVFRRLLLRSDDNWGYHRDLHGDYSYYDRDRYYGHDRDWRDDSYYRWHDYRDRDDRSSWNRIDP